MTATHHWDPVVRGTQRQTSSATLAGTNQTLAVADYTYETLPQAARDAVPTDTELAAAAGAAFTDLDRTTATIEPIRRRREGVCSALRPR